MIKYLNGLIGSVIPNEKTLSIAISEDEGQPLLQNIKTIADTYHKHVSCVCFVGTGDQHDLAKCCKIIHSYKLKTALFSSVTEISQINKVLTAELDYIKLDAGNIMKKDYCPFGDIEDWINAE